MAPILHLAPEPDKLSPMLEGIISDRPIEPRTDILHHTEGADLLPAQYQSVRFGGIPCEHHEP